MNDKKNAKILELTELFERLTDEQHEAVIRVMNAILATQAEREQAMQAAPMPGAHA
jgi:hemerythrin